MTEKNFTNRIDGLINDYEGGESTSKELRDGILDTLIELVSKVSPFEAPVSPMLAEWINVKNKLPEAGEKVLVGLDNGWVILIGRLMNNGWTAFYSDGECLVNESGVGSDVTHWMPLPEPPKQ